MLDRCWMDERASSPSGVQRQTPTGTQEDRSQDLLTVVALFQSVQFESWFMILIILLLFQVGWDLLNTFTTTDRQLLQLQSSQANLNHPSNPYSENDDIDEG